MWIDLLGYFAAFLGTAAFVPQVWKTYRTRDVSGISLGMYMVFTPSMAAWLAYSLITRTWPLVLSSGVTLALAFCVLWMKLRYETRTNMPTAN